MTIQDFDPAGFITETYKAFGIQSDIDRINATDESAQTLEKLRKQELDEARNTLRALSRTVGISKQSTEAAVALSAKREHGAAMMSLDREKFALAKSLNELESSSHNLEGTLARLKEELETLDGESPMQSTNALSEDETLLRLKVYRSFGIELEEDGAGGYSKAVVHNAKRGDVHVLKFDKKFKRTFYTNYFWNSI